MILAAKSHAKAMDSDGYVIIKNAVPQDLLFKLPGMIDSLDFLPGDDPSPSIRHKNVFNRNPSWMAFIDLPPVLRAVEPLLGGDCHIIGQTAWKSLPGHEGSPPHIDWIPRKLNKDQASIYCHPPMIITAHIFPHEVPEELGPTRIVPGSHRFGGTFHSLNAMSSAKASPGDVLLFRSDLIHEGGRNATSDRIRYLLQIHYASRCIAQHFHPYLEWRWNADVLASANPTQLRLLGKHQFSSYD